jgi:hypothetical protein
MTANKPERSNAVGVGMVMAAAIIVQSHGSEVEAEEILRAAGVDTATDAHRIGVDDYDLKILRPVFRHMAERRASQVTAGGAE